MVRPCLSWLKPGLPPRGPHVRFRRALVGGARETGVKISRAPALLLAAPGENPDPKRPGCPLVDTDKDGIPDHEDACPSKAGPATADPTHSGCPSEKKRAAAPEEAAPPAESPDAPQTVKKRRAK